jgi:hypothetical protein
MSIGARGRIILWFVVGVVLATGVLLAIQSRRPPAESMTLRSYDMRPEIANANLAATGSLRSDRLVPAAALTSAVAVVVFAFPRTHPQPIELQLNGARLAGERSQGTTLRVLDNRKVVALPSGDPNVRLYWIEDSSAARKMR